MKKTKPKFSIIIKTNYETFKGKGETAVEALRSIKKPLKVMWRGTVTVEEGKKKVEILVYPVRLRRLFYNKMFQEIQMKKICSLMK
jgi:hypothetical protein